MSSVKDLTGLQFGRLSVIAFSGKAKNGALLWECLCTCGNRKITTGSKLRTGYVKSCGCLVRETTGNRARKHGMKNTRLNRIWRSIKYRCSNPNHKDHAIYYDRGIKVCSEWENDFKAFYDWAITHGYRDDLSIDRIDNAKGYSPDNCRWATAKEQRLNQRRCYG